jgi:subtilisin family serine protease
MTPRSAVHAAALAALLAVSSDRGEASAAPAPATLVRLAPGRELPASLRAGARHLFAGWWRIAADPAEVRARLGSLQAVGIDRIEADRRYRLEIPFSPPRAASKPAPAGLVANDPLFPQQWHHSAIQAESAWLRATGAGVVVAVVDSGVRAGGHDGFCHPLAGEYDAVLDREGPGEALDVLGHGTFVASVVAECTGNGVGAAGVAPDARILAVKACTPDSECASSDVAAGIDWATEHGARVINLSLGMPCDDADWPACSTTIENDAIARAVAAGVSIVAVAGNRGEDHPGFPANHPDVIGVGGLDGRLLRTTYTSWGAALSLTAPAGEPDTDSDGDGHEDQILQETLRSVCGPLGGFEYCRWSGTSFAGPHVAGALALLLDAHPQATRGQLRRALEESALDRGAPGFDPIYAHGALQLAGALDRLDAIVAEEGSCVPSATRLCLGGAEGRRFAVEVAWSDYSGANGSGRSHPLTVDSGLFWFFTPENLELLVKVVDGCDFNGHHWAYAAATTDVGYTLVLTDTTNGRTRTFANLLGTASPAFTDSAAFPCAPAP